MRSRPLTLALFVVLMSAVPLWAITAGDVLDRMTEKERLGYIGGAVDMAIYSASTKEKNNPKAECIHAWFFEKDAKGPSEVIQTFSRYRDRQAVGLITVLIERACGK